MSLSQTLQNVRKKLLELSPGERVKLFPPAEIIGEPGSFEWDIIEEIQMEIRGILPENTFATLKFNDDETEFYIDMYRLP